MLIDSMWLQRLVTLRTAVGTLMTVPLRMPGGGHVFDAESDIPPLCSPDGALVF